MVIRRLLTALLLLSLGGCDLLPPTGSAPLLVAEGYLETGHPLPPITLSPSSAVEAVRVQFRGTAVAYRPASEGVFVPEVTPLLQAGDSFTFYVRTTSGLVTARDTLPPPVALEAVCVTVPEAPVRAVFADSLSPQLQEGYLYPITVHVTWDSLVSAHPTWMHVQLQSNTPFPSAVLDFFLKPEEIFFEPGQSDAVWTGVYAVPAPDARSSLPPHRLTVHLIRSYSAYARFARTYGHPELREPASNLSEGRGLLAGMARDTLSMMVTTSGTTCLTPHDRP